MRKRLGSHVASRSWTESYELSKSARITIESASTAHLLFMMGKWDDLSKPQWKTAEERWGRKSYRILGVTANLFNHISWLTRGTAMPWSQSLVRVHVIDGKQRGIQCQNMSLGKERRGVCVCVVCVGGWGCRWGMGLVVQIACVYSIPIWPGSNMSKRWCHKMRGFLVPKASSYTADYALSQSSLYVTTPVCVSVSEFTVLYLSFFHWEYCLLGPWLTIWHQDLSQRFFHWLVDSFDIHHLCRWCGYVSVCPFFYSKFSVKFEMPFTTVIQSCHIDYVTAASLHFDTRIIRSRPDHVALSSENSHTNS